VLAHNSDLIFVKLNLCLTVAVHITLCIVSIYAGVFIFCTDHPETENDPSKLLKWKNLLYLSLNIKHKECLQNVLECQFLF
jgi:hypothetical protein